MLFGDKVSKMNGLETATNREKKMLLQKTLGQLRPSLDIKNKWESEGVKRMSSLI